MTNADLANLITAEFNRLDGRISSLEQRIDSIAADVRELNAHMHFLRSLRERVDNPDG